ncbi:MAG: Na+/H+ antiporter NhaA [Gammaproteobacteria bacterium]|jgi:NhaA family Na+:H+ antiporter
MDSNRKRELIGGGLLFGTAILALIFANSTFLETYVNILNMPFSISVGAHNLVKPLTLWINDGLMALFFLLIGLEVKREFLEGDLSKPSQVALPAIGALGGMIVPAVIYILFNHGDSTYMKGWAIPVATDIAFVLGVLALLGPRVPRALRAFLLALAIFDDIGAIIVIALFYTSQLSFGSMLLALSCLLLLFVLNRLKVRPLTPYMLLGILMWFFVLKSGVHATLAGVALGLMIPHRGKEESAASSLLRLEHNLQPWVVYFVVPVFAFTNAGLSFAGSTWSDLFNPITLGISLGLLLGKQIGVFVFVAMAIKCGFAQMLRGTTWPMLYAGATLCGIGFTMSLFIASLAFQDVNITYFDESKLGILMGSLLSGVISYILLRKSTTAV